VNEAFELIGRDLWLSGAVSSHGGNMSARIGDRLFITRTGSMLGHLGADDIIETALRGPDARDERCSVELVVHRAIYEATDARAIVHAHTVHTIARSLIEDRILPVDSESLLRLGEVLVVEAASTVGSPEAGALLAEALKGCSVAVLRSHGPFAIGASLEDAFMAVSCLEASCEILDILDSTGHRRRGRHGEDC
jgi:L-fuculose-phosphate aldolase